jgi:integrase
VSDLKEDGIHVTPRKTANTTGKSIIITWTDELRAAVASAKAARPVKLTAHLFCNRDGRCYFDEETGRAGGWESMWRGFTERVLAETEVKERFTEHDIRAKCGSDAASLEHAQQLLSHANSAITNRVYRRKPERVSPLR